MSWEKIMRGARYHEAGHAVVAYFNGYEITGITVTDEEWITNFRRPFTSGSADAWRKACTTLAGWFADTRIGWGAVRPQTWREFLKDALYGRREAEYGDEGLLGDQTDLLEELEEMACYDGITPRECYQQVVEDTRRLVSEHWAEIEALARALEQNGHLDGPEAVRIIEQTS